jgi:Acetyltransferase (GNAT) domain
MIIREGDVCADGARIARALTDYLTPLADRPRFDWLYKRNPAGPVRVWLALDETEQLIGTAAAFPRILYMAGQQRTAWVFGDFWISDRHRSLGPALALQRALLEGADAAGITVSYDFPSTAMTAVYRRLKIEPASRMIRMAKMLRVDRKLRECVRNEVLVKGLSSLGNIFLSVTGSRAGGARDIAFSLLDNRCGSEFDGLADRVAARSGLCVRRSSEYLNWRYVENPYKKHELMLARRDGALQGFVILSQNREDGEIVDVFGEDERVVRRLIDTAVELFRRRGVVTVSVELVDTHPWKELFKKSSFHPRESKPFIVYTSRTGVSPFGNNGLNQTWFITGGDRDS